MRTMSFDEIASHCTPDERDQLAWFLAMFRARKTWERFRSRRHDEPPMMDLPPEGWKPQPKTES